MTPRLWEEEGTTDVKFKGSIIQANVDTEWEVGWVSLEFSGAFWVEMYNWQELNDNQLGEYSREKKKRKKD